MDKKIYLIPSYAKSGSNWAAIFLSNYLSRSAEPISISSKLFVEGGISRFEFEQRVPCSSELLSFEEIDRLMPVYFRHLNESLTHPHYLKLHDANTKSDNGHCLFPKDVIGGVVYLIRDPRDLVISYSHHFGWQIDRVISQLTNENATFNDPRDKLHHMMPMRSLSWDKHVASWAGDPDLNVTVLRYEDMLTDPYVSFEKLLMTFGLSVDRDRLERAIAFSAFDELKRQEDQSRVTFRDHRGEGFFRKGRSGEWKRVLSRDQITRLEDSLGAVMHDFDYL